MFNNLSTVTKVLMGVTALGVVATVVSAVKDHHDVAECDCCDEEVCECCELVDPTEEV